MVNINKFLDHHGRPIVKKDDDLLNQKIQVEAEVEEEIPNPEYTETMAWIEENFVDLGLPSGTLWAKKNLGADDAHPDGLRYGICNTVGTTKESDWSEHPICPDGDIDKACVQSNIEKYLIIQGNFNPANITGTIRPEYDAAYQYNKLCCIPTKSICTELMHFADINHTIKNNNVIINNALSFPFDKFIIFGDKIIASNSSLDNIIAYYTFGYVSKYDYFDNSIGVDLPRTACIRPVITKESLETNLPPKTIKQTVTKTVEMTVKEYIDMKIAGNTPKDKYEFELYEDEACTIPITPLKEYCMLYVKFNTTVGYNDTRAFKERTEKYADDFNIFTMTPNDLDYYIVIDTDMVSTSKRGNVPFHVGEIVKCETSPEFPITVPSNHFGNKIN